MSAILVFQGLSTARAQTPTPPALTGHVSSQEEGSMEGVLVSAKKAGSTITVTVVSDQQGRYRFPGNKLGPGQYSLRIQAVGYDLEGPRAVEIPPQKTATADLKLRKASDLASQLSNAEWLASVTGTEEQKASIRGCTHCHTLERVMRTRYDAAEFEAVLNRMSAYAPGSFEFNFQPHSTDRIGAGEPTPDQRARQQENLRRRAEYLSTINLSRASQWEYSLKTLPRPKGRATQVIYTEYDLPEITRQPHDAIVDSEGTAWYASFGEQILGKVDAKTGKVTEYPVPLVKPGRNTGTLELEFDEDENLWLGNQFQAAVHKFDKKTEEFQTWRLPPELDGDHVELAFLAPGNHKVDGKVWVNNNSTWAPLRLDLATGKWEEFTPFPIPRPNIYQVMSDAQNNGYFTVFGRAHIGRIDAKTGEITIFETPTPRSGPRRGMIDSQGRFWFSENRADKIGMFDTRTEKFQEWDVPIPGALPYDVTSDKNGEVWTGGEFDDRVLRLDPETGQFTVYALPSKTNIRRVFVDNSTTPVTFWAGNTHAASIVKLEPLD
jgi:streptogramin lyase